MWAGAGAGRAIFTPADGYNWLIAKTTVEIADANLHEAVAHLARTHLLMEPFVVAAHRQLAGNHPVLRLLRPHFRGTLAINEAAWRRLIADGGAVDRVFAGKIDSTRKLAADGLQQFQFRNGHLPKVLAALGVADREALPEHPYRDDARSTGGRSASGWATTWRCTTRRTRSLRPTRSCGRGWTRCRTTIAAASPASGPEDADSMAALTDVLTMVVFTCSVQHAAVNFPQYDVMSYAPRMPFAAYAPPPMTKASPPRPTTWQCCRP